jgi:hypothetical protein
MPFSPWLKEATKGSGDGSCATDAPPARTALTLPPLTPAPPKPIAASSVPAPMLHCHNSQPPPSPPSTHDANTSMMPPPADDSSMAPRQRLDDAPTSRACLTPFPLGPDAPPFLPPRRGSGGVGAPALPLCIGDEVSGGGRQGLWRRAMAA